MNIAILVIFLILVAGIVYLLRHATYGKLSPIPGEVVLYEEEGVRLEELFRGTERIKTWFRSVYVVVTNQRIILSLKPWLVSNKKKYPLRAVINYAIPGPKLSPSDLMGGFLLDPGYLVFTTLPERITAATVKDQPAIEITIPFADASPLLAEPKLQLFTAHSAAILAAVARGKK